MEQVAARLSLEHCSRTGQSMLTPDPITWLSGSAKSKHGGSCVQLPGTVKRLSNSMQVYVMHAIKCQTCSTLRLICE